jgi:hypothetical protein
LQENNYKTIILEIQFTPHDLCDENHELQVEARVQALLNTTDNSPPQKIRPCNLHKLINSLQLRKVCGIDGIPNASGTFQDNLWYTSPTYLIIAFGCPIFNSLGRKQKS